MALLASECKGFGAVLITVTNGTQPIVTPASEPGSIGKTDLKSTLSIHFSLSKWMPGQARHDNSTELK